MDNPLRYSFPVHNIYWRHETAVLNFLCGPLVTRCAHVAARTMLLIISTELCLLRWVASSGYIDDDNGFGQEDEMLHLSQLHVCVFCVFMFCVFLFVNSRIPRQSVAMNFEPSTKYLHLASVMQNWKVMVVVLSDY